MRIAIAFSLIYGAIFLAATAAVAATALAGSLFVLSSLRFVAGAATAAVIPLSLAYIGDITAYEHRQAVLARYMTGTILGLLFGQVAGGIIMELAGWRAVFLVLGGAYALITALLVIELRSPRVVHRRLPNPIRPSRVHPPLVPPQRQHLAGGVVSSLGDELLDPVQGGILSGRRGHGCQHRAERRHHHEQRPHAAALADASSPRSQLSRKWRSD